MKIRYGEKLLFFNISKKQKDNCITGISRVENRNTLDAVLSSSAGPHAEPSHFIFIIVETPALAASMTEQMTFRGILKGHNGWMTQIATTSQFPDMILSAS